MDKSDLIQLLRQVAAGEIEVETAGKQLIDLSYEELDYACLDHHRSLRKGLPEVIFGQGKTAEQIQGLMGKMIRHEKVVMATRVEASKARQVTAAMPNVIYHEDVRILIWYDQKPAPLGHGTVLVISADTSDLPVAKEAFLTAEAMGNRVEGLFDVGVAGMVSRPVIAVPTSIGYGASLGGSPPCLPC